MPLQDELEGEMPGQTKRLITLHPFSPKLGDSMYYVTSDQIEQEFISMSDLKNDVAGGRKTQQSSISALLSSKRAAPDTPSVERAEKSIVCSCRRNWGNLLGTFPSNPTW